MADLDPQLQALIDNQQITSNWAADYPYHPLSDANGNPAVIRVANDFLSAWLTRGEDGTFSEVTVLSEEQLGRIYDQRPGADLPNRVVERDEPAWINRDNPSESWPGDAYEQVVYNTQTGAISDEATMFEANAQWLSDGQQGERPFNKAILRSDLITDGVVSADDLQGDESTPSSLPQIRELPNRLPASAEFFENTRHLEQTVDSKVKAQAEPILLAAQQGAAAQIDRVRAGLDDPSVVYSDADNADGYGLQYEQGLRVQSQGAVDVDALARLQEQALNSDADRPVHPGVEPNALGNLIAGIEQRRAEAVPDPDRTKIGVQETRTNAGQIPEIQDLPEIPALQDVLKTPADINAYADEITQKFEAEIRSNDPNQADGFAELDERLAALPGVLTNALDAGRLESAIYQQIDTPEAREQLRDAGIDPVEHRKLVPDMVRGMQQEMASMIASGVLTNADTERLTQDALNDVRAQMPDMIDREFERSISTAEDRIQRGLDIAGEKRDAAVAAQESVTPENIDKLQVETYMNLFRVYKGQPGGDAILETFKSQDDPNVKEAFRLLELEEQGSQPAPQGIKP